MKALLRDLFVDNPMLVETTRMRRGIFLRGAGATKFFPRFVMGMVALIYLWVGAAILKDLNDWTIGLLYVELVLITLVVPMSIFGAVAGERERATWEALILTRLTPAQIVAGKLASRVMLSGALILFFSPLMVVGHISAATGGTQLPFPAGSAFTGQLVVFTWSLLLCTFGLWISSNSKRSITSIALIYGTLITVLALVPLLLSMLSITSGNFQMDLYNWYNPFYSLAKMPSGPVTGYQDPPTLTAWGLRQSLLYFGLSVFFVGITYFSLKRLEEPQRK